MLLQQITTVKPVSRRTSWKLLWSFFFLNKDDTESPLGVFDFQYNISINTEDKDRTITQATLPPHYVKFSNQSLSSTNMSSASNR